MEETLTETILKLLDSRSIDYSYLEHKPTITSEDSARVRGTSLEQGAKALIFKADGEYIQIVVPSHLRVGEKLFKAAYDFTHIELVSKDEVQEICGCPRGAIPPFGNLLNLRVFVDVQLSQNDEIAFNVGSRTKSIIMKYRDWQTIVNPVIGAFAKKK